MAKNNILIKKEDRRPATLQKIKESGDGIVRKGWFHCYGFAEKETVILFEQENGVLLCHPASQSVLIFKDI